MLTVVVLCDIQFSFDRQQLLGLILGTAMLWMFYIQSKDRQHPEPTAHLALAFILGVAACGLAILVFSVLGVLGVPDIDFGETRWTAIYCFGIVGPLEEGCKLLVAALFVFRSREYDEPLDGFVYAASIAVGFASLENFVDTANTDGLHQLAHTIALPITHVLFSSIWGFGLGYARFCVEPGCPRVLLQVGSIVLAMFAHGLYDFITFAFQARLVTSAIALALWVFVIWRAHVLGKRSAAAPAQAPSGK